MPDCCQFARHYMYHLMLLHQKGTRLEILNLFFVYLWDSAYTNGCWITTIGIKY